MINNDSLPSLPVELTPQSEQRSGYVQWDTLSPDFWELLALLLET